MYDPVIFDLDGTLLNTIGDLAAAGNFTLEKMGFPLHTVDEFRAFVGNGIRKLIERMLPDGCSEETIQTAYFVFGEFYELHKADKTVPYEGITELLSELNGMGISALCLTNKDYRFSKELLYSFFGENIAEVVGAGIGYPIKPEPSGAVYLAEKYSRKNKKPLYVGDSGVDMMTAKNAGLDACGVLWGFRGRAELESCSPKYLAENVSELRRIIIGG